jgi:hypothetical protein
LEYWSIGKFYLGAKHLETNGFVLSLIDQTIFPENEILRQVAQTYNKVLLSKLRKAAIPESWINSAKISIHFNSEYQHKYHYFGSGLGDRFTCSISITDDFGRTHSAEDGGICRPHNPLLEQRSVRRN